MISNWDFSLVLAISELLVDPQQPSSLLDIKLHAFQNRRRSFLRRCPGDTSVVCMQCIVKLPSDFTDRIQ